MVTQNLTFLKLIWHTFKCFIRNPWKKSCNLRVSQTLLVYFLSKIWQKVYIVHICDAEYVLEIACKVLKSENHEKRFFALIKNFDLWTYHILTCVGLKLIWKIKIPANTTTQADVRPIYSRERKHWMDISPTSAGEVGRMVGLMYRRNIPKRRRFKRKTRRKLVQKNVFFSLETDSFLSI